MNVRMLTNLGTDRGPMRRGTVYELDDQTAISWIAKRLAEPTSEPPAYVAQFLARLDDGAGRPCLFMPFVGEFGHLVMSHVRFVHFHRASEKVVCCQPGQEVLFPSATAFDTEWVDPVADIDRVGTFRDKLLEWPELVQRHPNHHPVRVGGLTMEQELYCIEPTQRIQFRPKRRGLKVDVVFGIRKRVFATEKNWQHWQQLAAVARAAGLTFAVAAARDTSFDLPGQMVHTGDLDTDAAIELMQSCRLFVGSDSGGAHLASTVGCPMLIIREPRNGMRDFVPRMAKVNPGHVEFLPGGWDNPGLVAQRMLELAGGEPLSPVDAADLFVAQHGEDRWMAKRWPQLGLPDRGVFVEVGASDGKHFSNTYWLEKAKGWRGLLVEPDHRSSVAIAGNRPASVVEYAAAGRETGTALFGLSEIPEHSGLLRETDATSTVAVFTLTELLERHGFDEVDVLSIDTEGSELEVWAGLDLKRWRPRLVIVEWDTVGLPSARVAVIDRLGRDGYKLAHQLGGNLLFLSDGAE